VVRDSFLEFLNDEDTFFQMEKDGTLTRESNVLDHHCSGHKDGDIDGEHKHG
jgi:hypothetical protein